LQIVVAKTPWNTAGVPVIVGIVFVLEDFATWNLINAMSVELQEISK